MHKNPILAVLALGFHPTILIEIAVYTGYSVTVGVRIEGTPKRLALIKQFEATA